MATKLACPACGNTGDFRVHIAETKITSYSNAGVYRTDRDDWSETDIDNDAPCYSCEYCNKNEYDLCLNRGKYDKQLNNDLMKPENQAKLTVEYDTDYYYDEDILGDRRLWKVDCDDCSFEITDDEILKKIRVLRS